ncbi:hypothetical protein [Fontivita pretiosa]|uniref:hypothetical protein n=1 Tax=Fontivita pretiosa TaxID=2989684 RepID=UPI003D17ED9D
MQSYLVRFECRSPYLTPWRSCTVWGRLSWIIASGAVAGWNIQDWIAFHNEGEHLLIVGDGLPYDAIPVPAVFLANASGPHKRPKTLAWPQWLELCRTGAWPTDSSRPHLPHEVQRQHVRISRATGTALEGQLRTERGQWPSEGIAMAVLVDDALGADGFRKMLDVLCAEGWGYGRSYGYGHIELRSIEPLSRPAPTGYVATMGHCHPTDNLPQQGWWRWSGVPVLAHDPATRRAILPHRFTTMLAPGATFATDQIYLGQTLETEIGPIRNYLHAGIVPTWPVHYSEATDA